MIVIVNIIVVNVYNKKLKAGNFPAFFDKDDYMENVNNNLMQYLVAHDIIDFAQIQADMMNEKRSTLLSSHKYKISLGKDGYYRTYVDDASKPKGRRQIKKRCLKDLEDEVVKCIELSTAVTISDLFEDYLSRKKKNGGIKESTALRYKNVFRRHYESTEWDKRDIRDISPEQFSDFLDDEIGRCNLNSKALSNLKGITRGILRRAMKRGLINYPYSTVFELMDETPKNTLVDKESQVLMPNELSAFIRYVENNQNVFTLSLLFMVVSGLRVGEMSTLKFSDFVSETSFNVKRTETFYKADDKYVYDVSECPKTDAGIRTAYIPAEYAWVAQKLRQMHPFAEYVCTDDNGERIRSYRLRNHLYGICRKLPEFKTEKSTHKLRKTFCSILLDSGFDRNLIISIMGHTDIKTSENFYHFDRKSSGKKQEMLDKIVEFRAI